jgi:hypothetical protein
MLSSQRLWPNAFTFCVLLAILFLSLSKKIAY